MRIRTLTAILLSSLLVVSCASHKPLVTPAEIASAEDNGVLDGLYNHVKSELVGKSRSNKKDAAMFAQLDLIGRKLAVALDTNLRKQMNDARLKSNLVPLDVLTEVQSAGEPMRTWEPSRHDVFNKDVIRETAVTQKAIRDVTTYIEHLPAGSYRKNMDALGQLAALSGDTRYSDQREAMLRSVRGQFEQARTTDDFDKALVLLDQLPADDNTEHTRVELQTGQFERQFNESLANGNLDEAYHLFETLAQSPYFREVKSRVGPIGIDIANYFVAEAENSVASGNIANAYRWFSQARNVHLKLEDRSDTVPEEKPFLDRVQRGHDNAKNEQLWGLALGYLSILQDFDPARATLANDMRAAGEQVGKLSTRSASVAPFSSSAGGGDYSNVVSGRLSDDLFLAIPNDVRIIAFEGKGATIDYLVSGSIDEARVETSQTQTRKTERVITESAVLTRNPKYDEWLKLPERQRRNTPQPAAQFPVDRKEDISYNVFQMRKVGYFSVSFRVVEAATGKVMHTDSLTLKREFNGEGNEGVNLGQFQLPAKAASLPTDIEILNQLSNEASQEIGKRLAARLGDLEKRFADAGKQAAANGNPVEAAQNYAYAVSVAQRKGLDATEYRNELKRSAAAAGYAR